MIQKRKARLMQKTMFRYLLLTIAFIGILIQDPITEIKISSITGIVISVAFYIFYAGLTVKNRNRSWKSLGLMILFSLFYLAYLAYVCVEPIRTYLDPYMPVGMVSLIAVSLLCLIAWLRKNREALRTMLTTNELS